MQIILSHLAEIKLTSQSKSVNSQFIEKYIGIKNYKATDKQRKELFNHIRRSNYETMKEIENILKLLYELNGETHGNAGKYTINQLKSIKQRVENCLDFLCKQII